MPIFISSTFQDMQTERDFLIKKTFPKLREIAARRLVTMTPIDLRWGITQEDSQSGKVVELCLQEIERCQPFFIGIIGERYGWCPSESDFENNSMLFDQYQWLHDDIAEGYSVTEIEMQFAVLRRHEHPNAFFFIKKPRQDEYADDKLKKLVSKVISTGKILSDVIDNQEKLHEKGYCYYAYYTSPDDFAQLVEKSLTLQLDITFPLEEISDEWLLENRAQQAYLQELCDIYVPQANNELITYYLDRMQERYLMITSHSECYYGKSAFIANWIKEEKLNNKVDIVYHFVGVGYLKGNYKKILKRLCIELSSIYDLGFEPDNEHELKQDYSSILSELLLKINGQKHLNIIIDGLQHLLDDGDAKLLEWLPTIPENVSLIVTTPYHDATQEVFYRRYHSLVFLEPFEEEEVCKFVEIYLKKFGKKLSSEQMQVILTAYLSAVPTPNGVQDILTLKSLLSELVAFGSYDQLDERIAYYCENNLSHFYDRMFERLENDFGRETVRDIMGLIAYSRAGLSESEVIDISKVTIQQWSNLRYSIAHLLTLRNGKYVIDKFTIAQKIDRRYGAMEKSFRGSLWYYFNNYDDYRSLEECIFQCCKAGVYDKLYRYLLNVDLVSYLYKNDTSEFLQYWKILYEISRYHYSIGTYAELSLPETELTAYTLTELGEFAKAFLGDEPSAVKLFKKAKEIYESITHRDYESLVKVYAGLRMYDEALENIDKALTIARFLRVRNDSNYIRLLKDKGILLNRIGKTDKAVSLWEEILAIAKPSNINNATTILDTRLKLSASYLFKEDSELFKENIEKAISLVKEVFGEEHAYMGEACYIYGVYHERAKHRMEAMFFYQKSFDILTKWYPESHEKIQEARNSIRSLKNRGESFTEKVIDAILADSIISKFDNQLDELGIVEKDFEPDNDFLDFLDFLEGAADDLYLVDEGWEGEMREYEYAFRYWHECLTMSGRHIFNANSPHIYVWKDSSGRYRYDDKSFDNLKDAQVYYMIRITTYHEQYCRFKRL